MVQQSNNTIIQTDGLTKNFRDFWGRSRVLAVDNVDLDIKQGEVFGLLGPNGSGKSTTVKMILGLLFPTRGRIAVLEKPPGDVAINKHIGFLPEESYLYPFLNARETLQFYARLFAIPRSEANKRIDALLDMVGLSGVARRPIGEFSKGMARRIGLAQALINDPELIILDEPTSGLDPVGTRQIKDLIKELSGRGKTILLCSHMLADVEDVCSRISVMYGGKVRATGTLAELLTQSDYTQIRSKTLSAETIEKIKALISNDIGSGVADISSPRESLESYFLKIVEDAQQQDIQTSGARMGGAISNFLGTTDHGNLLSGRSVIDSLVKTETVAVTTQSIGQHSSNTKADKINLEVVEKLSGNDKTDVSTVDEIKAENSTESNEVARNVLNNLLVNKKPDQKK